MVSNEEAFDFFFELQTLLRKKINSECFLSLLSFQKDSSWIQERVIFFFSNYKCIIYWFFFLPLIFVSSEGVQKVFNGETIDELESSLHRSIGYVQSLWFLCIHCFGYLFVMPWYYVIFIWIKDWGVCSVWMI